MATDNFSNPPESAREGQRLPANPMKHDPEQTARINELIRHGEEVIARSRELVARLAKQHPPTDG